MKEWATPNRPLSYILSKRNSLPIGSTLILSGSEQKFVTCTKGDI